MEFTYKAFSELIDLLKKRGYDFSDYHNYRYKDKCVILRHDVDLSLQKALKLAMIEHQKKIKSTYFVLISTNFYNVFSRESYDILEKIIDLGHEIGLHFDETRYEINSIEDFKLYAKNEIKMLELLLPKTISVISMHRPSKWVIDEDISFGDIVNSYSKVFFKDFKYVSDSRMNWREDVVKIVNSNEYDKLHILTHPFWYSDKKEDMRDKLLDFINSANKERAIYQNDNFRNLFEVISEDDIR